MSLFTSHVCYNINELTIDVYIIHFESKQLKLIYERLKEILNGYVNIHKQRILDTFLHVTFTKSEENSTLFEYAHICEKMKNLYEEYNDYLNLYIRFPFSKLPRTIREHLEREKMNRWHVELKITKNDSKIRTYKIEIHPEKHQFATLVMNYERMGKLIMKDTFD